jgi:CheY-like chemotaxis protein
MAQSALAVGLDRGTMNHFLSRAGSRELAVECIALAHRAAALAAERRFELVACSYPLPDMVMREFCRTIRHRHSASRDAALLVLSLPEMQTEARRALPSGRTLVRSRHDNGPLLQEAIVHLLRVAPRRTLDVPIETSPAESTTSGATEARLVNISRSGMLVAHPEPPEVGHRFRYGFCAEPSAGLISGTAEVVRHTRTGRDAAVGFAARFISLLPEAEERLLAFLEPAI